MFKRFLMIAVATFGMTAKGECNAHRRQLLTGLIAVPFCSHAAAQSSATPTALDKRFTVTWYDVDAIDPDYPIFRGDVLNTSDATADAPVVSITAYDAVGNILDASYAMPSPPVIAPGEHAYLYGAAPHELPDDAVLEFGLCGVPESATEYTQRTEAMSLTLTVDTEERGDRSYRATGMVHNGSNVPAEYVGVTAVFVNPDGRVVGALTHRLERAIPAGKSMRFEIDHGVQMYHSDNPFTDLLRKDYTVRFWCGYDPNARFTFC